METDIQADTQISYINPDIRENMHTKAKNIFRAKEGYFNEKRMVY